MTDPAPTVGASKSILSGVVVLALALAAVSCGGGAGEGSAEGNGGNGRSQTMHEASGAERYVRHWRLLGGLHRRRYRLPG